MPPHFPLSIAQPPDLSLITQPWFSGLQIPAPFLVEYLLRDDYLLIWRWFQYELPLMNDGKNIAFPDGWAKPLLKVSTVSIAAAEVVLK